MSNAPVVEIDPQAFWVDPYPTLEQMRAKTPICFVPQLGATLITKRQDIFDNEKKIDIFSSDQPDGLMTKLMGQNLMRKDGDDHLTERKAIFPSVSPKTVKNVWKQAFEKQADEIFQDLTSRNKADMVTDIAMRISGEALKVITGLTQISWQEMDRVSQAMIDGCANYQGNLDVEAACKDGTAAIDRYIDEQIPILKNNPDHSLISVQMRSHLPEIQLRANVKLAISGGQNEPRDAIAGTVWALLTHPAELQKIEDGSATWLDAFEEYGRWMSPIGMSPRRVAKSYDLNGVTFEREDRVFFMFGSGNRDKAIFENPDVFNISRNNAPSITFGAGPHFCAGAFASRCLIADVALPMIFEKLPNLKLEDQVKFGGWAFRGPLSMPVSWR